jgi:hypothetical protein
MTKTTIHRRSRWAPLLFAAAASVGVALGACQEEEDELGEEGLQVPQEIADACAGYCEKLAMCNEETVASECEEKCKGILYACEEHEEDEALDQVQDCADEDCLALPLCTASAAVQCVTGLGL